MQTIGWLFWVPSQRVEVSGDLKPGSQYFCCLPLRMEPLLATPSIPPWFFSETDLIGEEVLELSWVMAAHASAVGAGCPRDWHLDTPGIKPTGWLGFFSLLFSLPHFPSSGPQDCIARTLTLWIISPVPLRKKIHFEMYFTFVYTTCAVLKEARRRCWSLWNWN